VAEVSHHEDDILCKCAKIVITNYHASKLRERLEARPSSFEQLSPAWSRNR
jgi:hypothetical protein